MAHENLGVALSALGKRQEAIAEYRTAIRLDPDDAAARDGLAVELRFQGKWDEAFAEWRTAIRKKPDYVLAHSNLGAALADQGKLEEAVAECRTATRLKPDYATAHYNLGRALGSQGKLDEAITEYRAAVRLRPDLARAQFDVAVALHTQGKWEKAIAEYRATIRLKPDYAEAHCNLGELLRRQGDFSGSLESYRRGHELGSRKPGWPYPSAAWVEVAERMLVISSRLPSVLRGEDKPRDNAERLAFAEMCYGSAERYTAAAQLWAEALEADPKLVEGRVHRYNAACAAALAGCGRGKDDPRPDDDARKKLRAQALGWLKAELAILAGSLEGADAGVRFSVARALQVWKADPDLAGLRDPAALGTLPAAERDDWRAFWDEVDRLLKPAGPE